MKYGLENSEALQKLIGHPIASKPIVHVAGKEKKCIQCFCIFFFQFFFLLMFVSCVIIAPSVHKKYNKKCIFCVCEGTNGKGSVAFKIARALREAGYKDGLFVSPHVSSFRERMQVCVYYRHLYF
jgi:folylpolyglutamate synthase/dihydropteroate synthase